ncbi:MAG: hypothetical protein HOP19_00595, partial [Acidobacteria bacterium]|nr:hypothetical protein [Acidobacteriota bacterium]
MKRLWTFCLLLGACLSAFAQTRTLQGEVVNQRNEAVRGATIEVVTGAQTLTAVTDGEGRFSLPIPYEAPRATLTLKVTGKQISENETALNVQTDQVRIT